MAKNIAAEAATERHNSGVRDERFQDAMKRTFELDKQIEALMEQHIKPLREDKREIKAKLREDFNVTATAFNARYAPYKFEAKARDNGDETSIDLLRELFDATPVGGQMDMEDVLNASAAKKNGATKAKGSAATH